MLSEVLEFLLFCNLKERVKKNFDRASVSYDEVAWVQKQCAQRLVRLLRRHALVHSPCSILDVGAGTGLMTQALLPFFPQAHYTLKDFSAPMLQVAAKKFGLYPRYATLVKDMEDTPLLTQRYDLVVSNFALQWSQDLQQSILNLSQRGSVVGFTCLLQGTFAQWALLWEQMSLPVPTHVYPSFQQLKTYLDSFKDKGTFSMAQSFDVSFQHPVQVVRYLKKLGAHYGQTTVNPGHLRLLFKKPHGSITLTYNVFFGLIFPLRNHVR